MDCFSVLLRRVAANSGYNLVQRHDLDAWAGWRRSCGGIVAPTFDPAFADQNQSFWIEARHAGERAQQTLGGIAVRRFPGTRSLVELMETGALWPGRCRHLLPPGYDIAGDIHYRGGLAVDPDHRGHGLAWLLCRAARAVSIAEGADWTVGHCFEATHRRGLWRGFGYTGARLFAGTGGFPPAGPEVGRTWLLTVSGPEMRTQARREAPALVGGADENLAAVLRRLKRRGQP